MYSFNESLIDKAIINSGKKVRIDNWKSNKSPANDDNK